MRAWFVNSLQATGHNIYRPNSSLKIFGYTTDEILFSEMMLNENEALQRMSNIIRTGIDYKALSDNGVALTTEPYFKSLMCALYKERIHRLLKKSRILLPVTEARLMMGVMDETGLLQAGQVFVQYSHMASDGDDDELPISDQRFIVKRSVVVTRNPCLHPGDVRQLEAVDVPELHHLVDCVVFPRNGPRPHPNEMAGKVDLFLWTITATSRTTTKIRTSVTWNR